MNNRKICTIVAVALGIVMAATVSASVAAAIVSRNGEKSLDDWYTRLEEVRRIISTGYYKDVDDDTLMQGAIDGMLASLDDPYSFYYTPEEMAADQEEIEGKYSGIGVLVTADDEGRLRCVRVYKNGPAYLAGLKNNDIILSANGEPVSAADSESLNAAVKLIKGEEGTIVTLEIDREGETLIFDVPRGSVETEQVTYQMLDDGIGYVEIVEFMGNAASGFKEALQYFKDNGARAMIVDVRNNPGGMLNEVLPICDAVLPEGVIVSMVDRNGQKVEYTSDSECYDIPMAVLVNGSSASASEVFSGAVQDYGVAAIVGTTTFGKGIVQATYSFDDDGAGVQITIQTYYTPLGRALHGVGVEPDVVVEQNEDYVYDYALDLEHDAQAQAAVEILLAEIEDAA